MLDTQFTTICPCCGRPQSVVVQREDLEEYRHSNKNIQNIFWYLSPAKRELFITGICETCWGDIFEDEDENEE